MEHGFKVMDEIPVSYYLDLVSTHKRKLAFIAELSQNPYVKLYREFESQLDTLLTHKNECRGHAAIPFFHEEIRNKGYHTTLNAILLAYKKGWLRAPVIPERAIVWPDLTPFQDQEAINWKNHIDYDLASKLGLNYLEEGESLGGVWFNDAENRLKNIMITPCSLTKENNYIKNFEEKYKFDKITVLKEPGFQLFYVLPEDDTGFSIMEGVLFTKNKVFSIVYSSPVFDLETLKRELSIVK